MRLCITIADGTYCLRTCDLVASKTCQFMPGRWRDSPVKKSEVMPFFQKVLAKLADVPLPAKNPNYVNIRVMEIEATEPLSSNALADVAKMCRANIVEMTHGVLVVLGREFVDSIAEHCDHDNFALYVAAFMCSLHAHKKLFTMKCFELYNAKRGDASPALKKWHTYATLVGGES